LLAAGAASPAVGEGLLLWNKLGSASEITNSAYGPDLQFYSGGSGVDVPANRAYVPGVFGGALTIAAGGYSVVDRVHNVVLPNLDQLLDPNRGTIEVWYHQVLDPVDYDYSYYRIFGGAFGLGSGIGFVSYHDNGLRFALAAGGTSSAVEYDITPLTGSWIHIAGVWDVNGIGGTSDKLRLYVNGQGVASTTSAGWGSTFGSQVDIGGGTGHMDQQFYMDNLKVFDYAKTDFSDRFQEGETPSPGFLRPEVMIGPAVYFPATSVTGCTYQLFGRESPFTDDWLPLSPVITGTGGTVYGFERGAGVDWYPSRAWNIVEDTDQYSLAFDGNDDFAFRNHAGTFNFTSGMTLEAWVKPAAGNPGGTLIAKAASASITAYRLGIDGSNQATFQVFDSLGVPFVDLSGRALTNEIWTHLAATYDGSSAALLINGATDTSMTATGVVRTSILSPVVVGSILGLDAYGGLIDEVRLWDHARSEQAIDASHTTKLTGSEAGLTAYWQLQDPGSQTAADSTSNGFDLTVGENSGPDALDPVWTPESFPGADEFDLIFEFGTSWFSIFWNTTTSGVYSLESTSGVGGGTWTTRVAAIHGTGEEIEYFELPTPEPGDFAPRQFYRVLGPPDPPFPNIDLLHGLIAYYPFDGNADDASGSGHDGVIHGATFTTNGAAGGAYQFDGLNDYIDAGDSALLDIGTNDFSISFWLQSTMNRVESAALIYKGSWDTSIGYSVYLRGTEFGGIAGRVGAEVASTTVGSIVENPNIPIVNDGGWHHVVILADRDGSGSIYVDDALQFTRPIGTDSGSLATSTPLTIGGRTFDSVLDGSMDEIRVYDRLLTTNEIGQLFNLAN
jgi:hypothetical protein